MNRIMRPSTGRGRQIADPVSSQNAAGDFLPRRAGACFAKSRPHGLENALEKLQGGLLINVIETVAEGHGLAGPLFARSYSSRCNCQVSARLILGAKLTRFPCQSLSGRLEHWLFLRRWTDGGP